jgi:hypothetical protein
MRALDRKRLLAPGQFRQMVGHVHLCDDRRIGRDEALRHGGVDRRHEIGARLGSPSQPAARVTRVQPVQAVARGEDAHGVHALRPQR